MNNIKDILKNISKRFVIEFVTSVIVYCIGMLILKIVTKNK